MRTKVRGGRIRLKSNDVEVAVQERTPAEVVQYALDEGVEIVDLRFCDLPGLMQHFSVPVSQLTEDTFEDGFGFDGSSIRGFQQIQESDMILRPDADTAVIDPFRQHKTLNLNCWVHDPVTLESYSRDPRFGCSSRPVFHVASTESTWYIAAFCVCMNRTSSKMKNSASGPT